MEGFKVKVKENMATEFEQYLNDNQIKYRAYPKPIENTYAVKCNLQEIVDIGYCINSLEDMPVVTLQ